VRLQGLNGGECEDGSTVVLQTYETTGLLDAISQKAVIISLRVFQNKVLMRVFGSKRDEVTGGWRKLHDEEIHNVILLGC
jgi:hypothetical protein